MQRAHCPFTNYIELKRIHMVESDKGYLELNLIKKGPNNLGLDLIISLEGTFSRIESQIALCRFDAGICEIFLFTDFMSQKQAQNGGHIELLGF